MKLYKRTPIEIAYYTGNEDKIVNTIKVYAQKRRAFPLAIIKRLVIPTYINDELTAADIYSDVNRFMYSVTHIPTKSMLIEFPTEKQAKMFIELFLIKLIKCMRSEEENIVRCLFSMTEHDSFFNELEVTKFEEPIQVAIKSAFKQANDVLESILAEKSFDACYKELVLLQSGKLTIIPEWLQWFVKHNKE